MSDEKVLDLGPIEELHRLAFPGPGVEVMDFAPRFRHEARTWVPALVAEVKRLRQQLIDMETAFDRGAAATQGRVAEWERRAKALAEMADQLKRSFA